MLRSAAARVLRARPSPLPSGAAPFSVLGFKDVLGAGAAEAATKLKQAVSGAPGVGPLAAAAPGRKSGAVSARQSSVAHCCSVSIAPSNAGIQAQWRADPSLRRQRRDLRPWALPPPARAAAQVRQAIAQMDMPAWLPPTCCVVWRNAHACDPFRQDKFGNV